MAEEYLPTLPKPLVEMTDDELYAWAARENSKALELGENAGFSLAWIWAMRAERDRRLGINRNAGFTGSLADEATDARKGGLSE